jgi:hypothetical protein
MSNTPKEEFSQADKIGFILVNLIYCPFRIAYYIKRFASLKTYRVMLDWVKKQNLPLDTARELKLPFYLAGITSRGTVYALHTDDARYCILMKTSIFLGRENFCGTLYCDRPLAIANEIISIQGKYICRDRNGEEDYGPNFKAL